VAAESRDELFREFLADFDGVRFAVGIEPVGNPIDGAELSGLLVILNFRL
jgi:hypothetical protein